MSINESLFQKPINVEIIRIKRLEWPACLEKSKSTILLIVLEINTIEKRLLRVYLS